MPKMEPTKLLRVPSSLHEKVMLLSQREGGVQTWRIVGEAVKLYLEKYPHGHEMEILNFRGRPKKETQEEG